MGRRTRMPVGLEHQDSTGIFFRAVREVGVGTPHVITPTSSSTLPTAAPAAHRRPPPRSCIDSPHSAPPAPQTHPRQSPPSPPHLKRLFENPPPSTATANSSPPSHIAPPAPPQFDAPSEMA